MAYPTLKTISRIYLISALLAAIVLSALPYPVIALVLLLLQVYSAYKIFRADLNLALTLSTLILVPLVFQTSVVGLFSFLLVIPAMPLLDCGLRENALSQNFQYSLGRKPTSVLKTLSIALLVVLVVSLILANWALTFTSVLLAAYLAGISAYILYSIPEMPLKESMARIRIIAGKTAETSPNIENRAKVSLRTLFTSPHPWVSIAPAELRLGRNEMRLKLVLTPPLSGPSKAQLQALIIDPWGLIQMSQTLEPVELYVIPKARYAEWLARKFLGQAELHVATTIATISPSISPTASRQGIEYLSSRAYQPGDRLKDMDWKHMCKFNQLVIKEYSQSIELAIIIAANLTAKDPEEADNLVYSLITLALTVARAAVPAAIAAYNHQEVLLITEAMNPREILERTLKLARRVKLVEPEQRFLQTTDIRRLKRTISQLEQVETEPAQRLAQLLRLEDEALQQGTKDHPATRAITKAAEYIPPPATIAVVSEHNHDAEALLVTLDKLKRRGYNIIEVI